jgi:hypothetical protein
MCINKVPKIKWSYIDQYSEAGAGRTFKEEQWKTLRRISPSEK